MINSHDSWDTSNPVSPCISECIMHIGVTNTPQQTEHLDMIYGRFQRADYSQVRAAIVTKYGLPTSTSTKSYENKMGATFQG